MSSVRQYVSGLTHEERHEIISSFETFEKQGYIGDEAIRIHAVKFITENSIPKEHIVMWMQQIAFEVYRFYYNATFK